jgi:hypothetical protein
MEYNIQGFYAHGWETVTAEADRVAAVAQLKTYRDNEPGTAFRITIVRKGNK